MARNPEHAAWEAHLASALDAKIEVVATRSRRRPLQLRVLRQRHGTHPPRIRIALHPFFGAGTAELREAVAAWVRSGSRARHATQALDEFIRAALQAHPAPARPPGQLITRGRTHDLGCLAEQVRRQHFAQELKQLPPLTWGRFPRCATRRSLRLGSCDPDGPLVRVHPVLDSEAVPEFFLCFILFHELLHIVVPPQTGRSGRWVHHSREFRERERAHPDHARVLEWERRHLTALLKAARRNMPLPVQGETQAKTLVRRVQRLLFGD
jgi:hypothetical protein